jgi:hypothetical protein
MINSTTCQKIVLQEVAPHSTREEKPRQELKMYLSKRASYAMIKMRGNVLFLYDLMTFN